MDISGGSLIPTWKNGRNNENYVGKRLDRFLIVEALLNLFICFRSWVLNFSIFDNFPAMMEWSGHTAKVKYQFTFNPVWIGEKILEDLIYIFFNSCNVDEPE